MPDHNNPRGRPRRQPPAPDSGPWTPETFAEAMGLTADYVRRCCRNAEGHRLPSGYVASKPWGDRWKIYYDYNREFEELHLWLLQKGRKISP